MLLKIAWRNIWRNPTRSFVVMGAIIVGVWSVIFLASMASGMADSYVNNAIDNEVSHIQIHHPDFPKDKEAKFYLKNIQELISQCENVEGVKAASGRSLSNAMIASGKSTRGIRVSGIIPEKEILVTGISEKIVEGEYLSDKGKSPILVSKVTAKKLNLKLRSKVVITMQTLHGDITAGAFRVSGIFESGDNIYDESVCFVRMEDLNNLLGEKDIGHEIAIRLDNLQLLDTTQILLQQAFPDLSVQSYKEISPELELFQSQIRNASQIYMFIFMLALIFGIINTMLMTVLERIRELGMLMAVGMNKLRVYLMILVETVFLGLVGAPIGLFVGWATIKYYTINGVDLSQYSEGLESFGYSSILYPYLDNNVYFIVTVGVIVTAVIGALYPAWKAIKLKPVEALHKL